MNYGEVVVHGSDSILLSMPKASDLNFPLLFIVWFVIGILDTLNTVYITLFCKVVNRYLS